MVYYFSLKAINYYINALSTALILTSQIVGPSVC